MRNRRNLGNAKKRGNTLFLKNLLAPEGIRHNKYPLAAAYYAITEHRWEDAAKILPFLFLESQRFEVDFYWTATNILMSNVSGFSFKREELTQDLFKIGARPFEVALEKISLELPELLDENIDKFFQKIEEITSANKNYTADRDIITTRFKALVYAYKALGAYCVWKNRFSSERDNEMPDSEFSATGDEPEDDDDFFTNVTRKQRRSQAIKNSAFKDFTMALTYLDEPCEWIMGPYLDALLEIEGKEAALEKLNAYLERYPSHFPAHYMAFSFLKKIPQSEESQLKALEKIAELSPDDPHMITLVEMLINGVDDWKFDTTELHSWSDIDGKTKKLITSGTSKCNGLFKSEIQRKAFIKCVKILMSMIEYREWRWNKEPWKLLCHILRRIHLCRMRCGYCEHCRAIGADIVMVRKEKATVWSRCIWVKPSYINSPQQAEIFFYSTYVAHILTFSDEYVSFMEEKLRENGFGIITQDLQNAKEGYNTFLKGWNRKMGRKSFRLPTIPAKSSGNNVSVMKNKEKKCVPKQDFSKSYASEENILNENEITFNNMSLVTSTQISSVSEFHSESSRCDNETVGEVITPVYEIKKTHSKARRNSDANSLDDTSCLISLEDIPCGQEIGTSNTQMRNEDDEVDDFTWFFNSPRSTDLSSNSSLSESVVDLKKNIIIEAARTPVNAQYTSDLDQKSVIPFKTPRSSAIKREVKQELCEQNEENENISSVKIIVHREEMDELLEPQNSSSDNISRNSLSSVKKGYNRPLPIWLMGNKMSQLGSPISPLRNENSSCRSLKYSIGKLVLPESEPSSDSLSEFASIKQESGGSICSSDMNFYTPRRAVSSTSQKSIKNLLVRSFDEQETSEDEGDGQNFFPSVDVRNSQYLAGNNIKENEMGSHLSAAEGVSQGNSLHKKIRVTELNSQNKPSSCKTNEKMDPVYSNGNDNIESQDIIGPSQETSFSFSPKPVKSIDSYSKQKTSTDSIVENSCSESENSFTSDSVYSSLRGLNDMRYNAYYTGCNTAAAEDVSGDAHSRPSSCNSSFIHGYSFKPLSYIPLSECNNMRDNSNSVVSVKSSSKLVKALESHLNRETMPDPLEVMDNSSAGVAENVNGDLNDQRSVPQTGKSKYSGELSASGSITLQHVKSPDKIMDRNNVNNELGGESRKCKSSESKRKLEKIFKTLEASSDSAKVEPAKFISAEHNKISNSMITKQTAVNARLDNEIKRNRTLENVSDIHMTISEIGKNTEMKLEKKAKKKLAKAHEENNKIKKKGKKEVKHTSIDNILGHLEKRDNVPIYPYVNNSNESVSKETVLACDKINEESVCKLNTEESAKVIAVSKAKIKSDKKKGKTKLKKKGGKKVSKNEIKDLHLSVKNDSFLSRDRTNFSSILTDIIGNNSKSKKKAKKEKSRECSTKKALKESKKRATETSEKDSKKKDLKKLENRASNTSKKKHKVSKKAKKLSKKKATKLSKNKDTKQSKKNATELSKNKDTNQSKKNATELSKKNATELSKNKDTNQSKKNATELSKKNATELSKNKDTNQSKKKATKLSKKKIRTSALDKKVKLTATRYFKDSSETKASISELQKNDRFCEIQRNCNSEVKADVTKTPRKTLNEPQNKTVQSYTLSVGDNYKKSFRDSKKEGTQDSDVKVGQESGLKRTWNELADETTQSLKCSKKQTVVRGSKNRCHGKFHVNATKKEYSAEKEYDMQLLAKIKAENTEAKRKLNGSAVENIKIRVDRSTASPLSKGVKSEKTIEKILTDVKKKIVDSPKHENGYKTVKGKIQWDSCIDDLPFPDDDVLETLFGKSQNMSKLSTSINPLPKSRNQDRSLKRPSSPSASLKEPKKKKHKLCDHALPAWN